MNNENFVPSLHPRGETHSFVLGNKLGFLGQTLLELVVGLSLITIVVGALAVTTTYSLRNSQFSKNQVQATKLAQELVEKARTIKTSNYGVCFNGQSACSTWEELWTPSAPGYAQFQANCVVAGCKFYLVNTGCTVTDGSSKPVCLRQTNTAVALTTGFTGEVTIQNEPGLGDTQKRVIAKVYWTDSSGEHSSDLVTVLTKL